MRVYCEGSGKRIQRRAKRVWDTDLYILAFGALRAVFSAGELNQWADTMAERGLRMRVGLDEVVGDWADAGAGRVGSDSDSDGGSETEDEIESSARERRRLMPY